MGVGEAATYGCGRAAADQARPRTATRSGTAAGCGAPGKRAGGSEEDTLAGMRISPNMMADGASCLDAEEIRREMISFRESGEGEKEKK